MKIPYSILAIILTAAWPLKVVTASPLQASAPQQGATEQRVGGPQQELAAAEALLQAGKTNDAIVKFKEFQARHPQWKGVARDLGIAYYRERKVADAVGYLKQAADEDPDDREATQLLGLSYFALGRPAEAIPLLEKVREWFPSAHLDASYYLGVAYLQIRKYPEAERSFAAVFAVPPGSAASSLLMARMLLRQEFEPMAEEYARKALEKDPRLPLAHFLMGEIHLYKSRFPEAVTEFEKELQLNPGHALTYTRLADAYVRMMRFDDAERVVEQSIYLDATASAPYMLLGKILAKKNDNERAALALERAVKLDPNNHMAHHLLGLTYRTLGRSGDADRELRLAQQLQDSQDVLTPQKKE